MRNEFKDALIQDGLMTPRSASKLVCLRELIWFAPFLCMALMALGLLRTLPSLPPPAHSRTVVDAGGTQVQIALPFRGVVLTWASHPSQYLATTRAPETILIAGGPTQVSNRTTFAGSVMSWVYPQVLSQDKFWDLRNLLRSRGPYAEIEAVFSYDAGAYIGVQGGPMPLIRHVGMPALYTDRLKERNNDEEIFTQTRVLSALVGQPERGEALIAQYRQAYADLEQELQPASITNKLRFLTLESSRNNRKYLKLGNCSNDINVRRAGLICVSQGFTGAARRTDGERVLAMDPDIIFQWESPEVFMSDSRWCGLKAVRERRVYHLPGHDSAPPVIFLGPLFWIRWMAEIAYPERMQPKLRQLLREGFMREFGYRVSDDQLDWQLYVKDNSVSAGYERFARDYQATDQATNKQGSSK
jgi:ABC-type Fe3+-hydroxamate transport system substrate-binding protein